MPKSPRVLTGSITSSDSLSSELASASTTGKVMTKRKTVGNENRLKALSQTLFSLQPCNVGHIVRHSTFGGGSTLYGHHFTSFEDPGGSSPGMCSDVSVKVGRSIECERGRPSLGEPCPSDIGES